MLFSGHGLHDLLHTYGYPGVFLGIMLESLGLPLPGESLMIAAAIYAATTHTLNIFILVPVAACGAICGDQLGYFIGYAVGFRLLARWGKRLGLSDERLELGRFLFRRYGGRVVFAGRFVALLRTFVALLSGANRMRWASFLVWNALGGVVWTSVYGFGAYLLGDAAKRISGPAGVVLGVIGGAALLAAIIYIKRNERRLIDASRQEMESNNPPHGPVPMPVSG